MWDKRTLTTLVMGDNEWNVEALRTNTLFRFCKGWNDFVSDNNLEIDEELVFHYSGDFSFQVRKV